MTSTVAGVQPAVPVERWDRLQKKTVNIDSPWAMQTYNKFMGGVDLNDCLTAHYRIHIKSNFYLKLFFHFIDLVIVVCWLQYPRDCKSLGVPAKAQDDLLKFRMSTGAWLLKQGKDTTARQKGKPSSSMENSLLAKKKKGQMKVVPVASVRTDSTGPWPVIKETRQRCKRPHCKGQTVFMCIKCNTHLCWNKNCSCFYDFLQE
ncbi:piggyBac transposable element-derived protein 3-like [Ixodes scapularis]|uniref:piggyBac transposable element-derived protein 3-like n=1 Tax=Ixodes scapularis TaxID=6945 RepID=UPI001A9F3B91|nr:piggyBac transposable element-derived protein 3-like [Ixodes scapularis]